MTVEVENAETQETEQIEEAVKTPEEVAKAMYPDDTKGEEGQESEETKETETIEAEKEVPEEEAKEEPSEQEETEDREDEPVTLTLSKDSPLEKTDLGKLEDYAKDNKLNQLEAEKVLQYAETQKATHEASVAEWTKTIEDHPEYGGDKLEAATLIALRPLKKYGGEEIDTFLKESGLSNHPAVFAYHHKIGLAMEDDKFVQGGQPPAKPKESRANRMYPKDVNKE